jgi:hypothetical protein
MSSKTYNSHISGQSTKSALGYTPIPPDLVARNKENCVKLINSYL